MANGKGIKVGSHTSGIHLIVCACASVCAYGCAILVLDWVGLVSSIGAGIWVDTIIIMIFYIHFLIYMTKNIMKQI